MTGRPRLTVPSVIFKFTLTLHPNEDDDLIAFLSQYPTRLRTSAVKQALRSGKLNVALAELPSDDEVESALDALVA